MDSIATNVSTCLQEFGTLCDTLDSQARTQPDGSPQRSDPDGMPLSRVKAELSRFKVWSANIGAHKKGRISLDHRLRDASNIRNQIARLLRNLAESLSDARDILTRDAAPWDEESLSPDAVDEDDSDDDCALELYSSAASELSQIFASIVENINCLLRLSVSIRNPAPHDRFKKSSLTDTSHFEQFDVQHVRTKFSTAPSRVVERLGKAISRRRQYFKYREMHHQKMASGLDADCEVDNSMQSTVASSIPAHLKQAATDISNSVDEDDISNAGRSQTSYSTSAANAERPKIPALPQEAEDGPFECPFCFMMISISSRRLWKKHVFTDLRPYVCMSLDCPAPDQDFRRRYQWSEHVQKYHWKTWTCSLGCNQAFTTLADMKHHLAKAHAEASKSTHLDSLLTLCERPKPKNDPEKCPLCDESLPTLKHYERHVGRHQEDLALFALPQLPGDREEGDDEREEGEEEETGDEEEEGEEEDLDKVQKLVESFGMVLDEAVIVAIAIDHDLKKDSEYKAAQAILESLAKDVASKQAAGFNPSGIAESPKETTADLIIAETEQKTEEPAKSSDPDEDESPHSTTTATTGGFKFTLEGVEEMDSEREGLDKDMTTKGPENPNSSDETSNSEVGFDEEAFLRRRYQIRKSRVMSTGAGFGKRTHNETSDSDDDDEALDFNDVGSSARRLRRRPPGPSLLFQDPPPALIDELEEPSSSEDEFAHGQGPATVEEQVTGVSEEKREDKQKAKGADCKDKE